MANHKAEVIAKWSDKSVHLQLGTEGKFVGRASGWDENRVFLLGDRLQIDVKDGLWILTHLPAGPRPPEKPVEHYFPTE